MADPPTSLPRKPRVPRRKELVDSYKSLEAAAADRAQKRKLDLEAAGGASSLQSETSEHMRDALLTDDLLTSPLNPSSQLSHYSDLSCASDPLQGPTSWLLGRSPEAAGINGLSGVTDGPPEAAAPPAAPAAGARVSDGTSHKVHGVGEVEDSGAEIPELGESKNYDDAGDKPLIQELREVVGYSDAGPGMVEATSSPASELSHKVIQVKDVVEEEPATARKPLLVLQFTGLTYTVCEKRSKWRRKPSAAAASILGAPRADEHCASMPTRLLDNISGEARDGEILAVMGPSGSGKSTLIDALAQRIDSLQGSMTLNGDLVSHRLLHSISAYVMQDDLLFPMLTVKETLMFSAFFRLPMSQSKAKKRARVFNLMDQLGLMRVANTIIGDEGHRGVSGGERRRVSIGIDIIHDPLLLFLDEPTSGLDSTSAYMVIRTLQNIAQTGSIVILSIHQPSYRILGLFDRLLMLAYGQKVFGGSPTELRTYFEAFGRPVLKHDSSTEHALDLIQQLHATPGGLQEMVEFCKSWKSKFQQSDLQAGHTNVREAIAVAISSGKLVAASGSSTLNNSSPAGLPTTQTTDNAEMVCKFANPWWSEILVLIQRSMKNIRRTPELFLMRLATVMVTGFLLATIFWHLDHTPKGVQERLGFFAFAMSTTYYTCADALPVFLQERYIFMRETTHNAYRKSSYVLAHAIIYVPFLAILSMAFSITIWWAVGLAGGGPGFLFFFLIVWASFWAGNSFVTLLSAVMPNVMLGYTVVVAMLAYFLLLSGFFISRVRIPKYWVWFHYLSLIKYPYEAVLINEFERKSKCYERGREILFGTPLASLNQSLVDSMLMYMRSSPALKNTRYAKLSPTSCVVTGHDVLDAKEITQLSKWACLGITIGFGIVFRCLFYVVLRLTGKNKRQ